MSKYQAIIFDLDGTAVPNDPNGRPSERLLQAFRRYRDDIHLIPASGRTVIQALPVTKALGVTGPCIFGGGTIIFDPVAQTVLKRTILPAATVRAIIKIARESFPAYPLYIREERIAHAKPAEHAHLIDDTELMMLINVPAADVSRIEASLAPIRGIAVSTTPAWHRGFAVNITHRDATKEHAVSEVLASLGVPPEAAIGVGDGGNDVHLFRSVGLKVAMGNASPELKAAADLIAPSIDQDGLAQIIEQYAIGAQG